MTYKMIEDYSSSFVGPGPRDPAGFAIHWWDDPINNPQFWAIVTLLLNRGAQQSASVNFVAEAGLVACLVDPFYVAWGQGDGGAGWGNNNLVSIECNPRCSAADRETVAELMADQHIKNGVPLKAYPHHNFTSTRCPGVWEQHIPWLIARAHEIVAEKTGAAQPAPVAPAAPAAPAGQIIRGDQELHWVVEPGDTLTKIALHYYADAVMTRAIATYNNIDPNVLTVGQKIWVPGPIFWTVEGPDTVQSICNYYGISWEWLAARNPNQVDGPNTELYIGNVLRIL